MRWSLSAVLFFSVICAVRTDDSTEPSLHIMARSSVFDVGETRAIFCKGINVLDPVEWYSPSGKLVEERSSSNNRIYVERPVNDNGILRPLILTNIKISDTGNWTCRAGNISETKEFIVGEKVKIPDKNVTIEGQEGESIRFTCEAKGHPSPVVTWYKDKTPINDKDKSGKYLIRSDNSLEINQLNHVDVGMYFCKVTQRALSHFTEKAIYFTVQHVPVLYNMEKQSYYETPTNTYKTEEVYAILNETKNISCGAIANPAAQYTWRRRFNSVDSDPITANDTVITSEDGSSSVLVLRLYNESYIGEYKCTAKNTKGNVSIVFDVTLGTKPEPPDYVSLIYSNTSMMAFNVTCSYCNLYSGDRYSEDPKNLTVLGYNFQFVPVREGYDDPDWDDAVEFPVDIFMVNDTSFTVGPLANSTKYFGRVRSRNAAGYSEWVNITPNPETTSYVARLAATFVLSTSLWLFTRIF